MQMRHTERIHTYTCTQTHTINATGKARVRGVSQGRLRLRALIDCGYSVYVPLTTPVHVSMCIGDLVDGNGSTGSDSVTLL